MSETIVSKSSDAGTVGGGERAALPHWWRHPLRAAGRGARFVFDLASLLAILAVIAAVPIVNLLALGYLFDVEGRVARSGRLRDGFPLLGQAGRIGGVALGFASWILPLVLLADVAREAALIDPGGANARNLQTATTIARILVAIHLCLALARGGGLSAFVRPILNVVWFVRRLREGGWIADLDRRARQFLPAGDLARQFWLGTRGFFGSLVWLVPPTLLFAAVERSDDPKALLTITGGVLLIVLFGWLPFLQARFAMEDRLAALFEWRRVRADFRRAPLAWLAAVLVLYLLALPLYLLKVRLPWDDAMWLATLVFVATMHPTRLVVGWAYHRAQRRSDPAPRLVCWACRLAILLVTAAFVVGLFFTPIIGQQGKGVLFDHHEFLLPVPY